MFLAHPNHCCKQIKCSMDKQLSNNKNMAGDLKQWKYVNKNEKPIED